MPVIHHPLRAVVEAVAEDEKEDHLGGVLDLGRQSVVQPGRI
jgi:hypothetical protein